MERDCVYSNMYHCKIRIEIAGRILMSSLRLNIYLKTRDKLKKIHILLKIWYSFYLRIQILNIFVKIFYLLDKFSYSNHLINSLLSLLEKNYYVFYTRIRNLILFSKKLQLRYTIMLIHLVAKVNTLYRVASHIEGQKKEKKKHVESAVPRAEDQRHSHCKFPFVRRLNTEQRTLKIFLDASRPSMRFVRFRMRWRIFSMIVGC